MSVGSQKRLLRCHVAREKIKPNFDKVLSCRGYPSSCKTGPKKGKFKRLGCHSCVNITETWNHYKVKENCLHKCRLNTDEGLMRKLNYILFGLLCLKQFSLCFSDKSFGNWHKNRGSWESGELNGLEIFLLLPMTLLPRGKNASWHLRLISASPSGRLFCLVRS